MPCPPFSVAGKQLGSEDERDLFPEAICLIGEIRPRAIIVGIRKDEKGEFHYPKEDAEKTKSVGETLFDLMKANGWKEAKRWRKAANTIAPTIVGGSKKHGGPDLGPIRARKAWAALGVNGLGVANEAPEPNFEGMPKLTPRMIARIQGFPDVWDFGKKKTAACRMIGNALPPPVACAVGKEIRRVLEHECIDC